MEFVFLLAIYLIETAKYLVANRLFFHEKIEKWWVFAVGAGVCVPLSFWGKNHSLGSTHLLLSWWIILLLFCTITGTLRIRMFHLISLVVIINCLDEVISLLGRLILGKPVDRMQEYLEYVYVWIIGLIVLVSLSAMQQSKKKRALIRIKSFTRKNIVIAVFFMAFSMCITIAGLNWMSQFIKDEEINAFFTVLQIVSYIGVAVLGVFIVYIRNTNERMEQMIRNEILLKQIQKHYYKELLEKEEETRRYRHDMNNHLLCLQSFMQEKNIEAMQSYLLQMQSEMKRIQKKNFTIGNDTLDAVTNYYIEKLKENVSVKVTGMIQLAEDNMQLCGVYTNLLQNAVEELSKNDTCASLEISFKQGNEFCQICVQNSLSTQSQSKTIDELLVSSKNDKRNHGWGIKNIKRAVAELEGNIDFSVEDNNFVALVTLKIDRLTSYLTV